MFFRLGKSVLVWLAMLMMGATLGWCFLVVYYLDFSGVIKGGVLAGLALCFGLALLLRSWWRRALLAASVLAFVLCWWLPLAPSNDRQWQGDVAVLSTAEIHGDAVTIRNVRNCDYRSETEYTVRHYDKQVQLSALRGVDLFHVHWGSPSIAHTMLSFDFGDGQPICFSIEARKTVDEDYSALAGFFRRYELVYVVGDERDLVRLRTNFRGEEVYLYRLTFNPRIARTVFLEYLRRINELAVRPEWYNAFLSNCTTNIRTLARPYTDDARWDWRLVANGHVEEMAYERGMLNTTVPLDDLRLFGRINRRARELGSGPEFSSRIREGVPPALGGL